MPAPWKDTLHALEAALSPSGFDCIGALNQRWLSALERGAWMGDQTHGGEGLGLVIGNSRALWPAFLSALHHEPWRLDQAHPLDTWVGDILTTALRPFPTFKRLAFAHTTGPGVVPIQRLAAKAGLGALSPGHLIVHPTFGPWFSLRGVALFEEPGPAGPSHQAQLACDGCQRGCLPAFHDALAHSTELSSEDTRAQWRRWLALRDACPLGAEHRFPDEAIRYHYTKEKSALREALKREFGG